MIEQLEKVYKKTANFIRANQFVLREFALVGSRARGDNDLESDFDLICVVNDDLSILESREVRCLIYERVILGSNINVGFKMFTMRQLDDMRLYDSYRLIEFKRGFYSFMGSEIIANIEAAPNEKSFLNSIIIQVVFETIARKPFGFHKNVVAAVTKRILRNNQIEKFLDIESFQDYENVLLVSNGCWQHRLVESLRECGNWMSEIDLYIYYKMIPHEYVNKSHEYGKLFRENRRRL